MAAKKRSVFISEFRIAVGQAINLVSSAHPDMAVDLCAENMKHAAQFQDTVERVTKRLLKTQGNMLTRAKQWDDIDITYGKK